jgi:tetratricopeptide (TPR) repeat protein
MKKILFCLVLVLAVSFVFAAEQTSTEKTYLKMADNVFEMGKYAYASELYKTALDSNPKSWQALIGMGNAAYMLGDIEKANKFYKQAQEINPDAEIPSMQKYIKKDNAKALIKAKKKAKEESGAKK